MYTEPEKEMIYKKKIRENLNNVLNSGYIPELGEHKKGKVRDIHFTSKTIGSPIIMIASDRVSAFDHVLNRKIPFKGQILNLLNLWALENSKDIIPNASIDSPHKNVIIQRFYKNIMIECVVRGYVWGSLASEYEKGERNFCGIKMPEGLLRYQKLDMPLFTPTTKAEEHDKPLTFDDLKQMLGEKLAEQVKEISLRLYKRGAQIAEERGLIFIDTKYEFGLDEYGNIFLIDEANTPDSSRFCTIEEYKKFEKINDEMRFSRYKNVSELLKEKPELKIKELSKQFVRDVLTEKGFSYGASGEPPSLSDEDVIEVSYRYIRLYELLTGNNFEFPDSDVKLSLIDQLKKAGYISGGLAVIIAGSDSDLPHIQKIQEELNKYNIKSQVRICSAHKQPGMCEDIIKRYNNSIAPIVFIAIAGGTDALSGVLSFHSIYPVISCPPKQEEHISCLTNPPGSSNSLILKPSNLARHVAQVFGIFNPELQTMILNKNSEKLRKLETADNDLRNMKI